MPNFVSLFAGAGGLDLGLERAGWRSLFATDIDPASIRTLEANRNRGVGRGRKAFADTIIRQSDVRALKGAIVLKDLGLSRGDVDLLSGGPPCQSWSSAGRQQGFDDPRGRLVDEYLRLAREIDARWLIFENVRGLLTARGSDGAPGSALAYVRNRLLQLGWQTRVELLNAADFGVPQRRVRLILIGYRAGDEPRMPAATHDKAWITLRSCLEGLAKIQPAEIIRPTGKIAVELEHLPAGTGVKSPGNVSPPGLGDTGATNKAPLSPTWIYPPAPSPPAGSKTGFAILTTACAASVRGSAPRFNPFRQAGALTAPEPTNIGLSATLSRHF